MHWIVLWLLYICCDCIRSFGFDLEAKENENIDNVSGSVEDSVEGISVQQFERSEYNKM